nr:hypothetical protein [Tanacetum cinerariifolium]
NQPTQLPEFSQLDSGLTIPVFKQGNNPIDAINHMMSFLSVVVTSRYPTTNNQLRNSSNPRQQATINDGRVTLQPEMLSSEQSSVVKHLETKITSDSNIISYSQYVHETQKESVQNSNLSTQQDALILFVIDQLKPKVINCTKINLDNKSVNDTLTTELERYKEQVNVLKDGQNKAQKLEPNLYDGNVIKSTSAIVIPNSEDTLMLAEESGSKTLLKQHDPMVLEKKVNTTPVDYAVLN